MIQSVNQPAKPADHYVNILKVYMNCSRPAEVNMSEIHISDYIGS